MAGACPRSTGRARTLGVVFGFPVCSAIALGSVPAVTRSAIVGLMPMATAFMTMLRNRDHHRPYLVGFVAGGARSAFAFGARVRRHARLAALRRADGGLLESALSAALGLPRARMGAGIAGSGAALHRIS